MRLTKLGILQCQKLMFLWQVWFFTRHLDVNLTLVDAEINFAHFVLLDLVSILRLTFFNGQERAKCILFPLLWMQNKSLLNFKHIRVYHHIFPGGWCRIAKCQTLTIFGSFWYILATTINKVSGKAYPLRPLFFSR